MAKLHLDPRRNTEKDPHHVAIGAGHNCGRCAKLTDFRKEKQSGWCIGWYRMMSSAMDVQCSKFEQKKK